MENVRATSHPALWLMAGIIRDRLGSFEWAWWSLTGVMALMILMVLRFDPRHYARHIS